MALQAREKKLLMIWPFAMAVIGAIYFWPASSKPVAATAERYTDVGTAEQRLTHLRQLAASIPARQKVLDDAQQELATREENLARAATPAQLQASLLQTVRKLARAQMIDFQSSDVGRMDPMGKDYGEAQVTVTFVCQMEQLVNLIADISAQKELMATREIQVRQSDEKRKTIAVRLAVSAVVPKQMLEAGKA